MTPSLALFALFARFNVAAPAAAPEWPPEASLHNERGVALVLAGDLEAGIAELEQAYAAMPDPVKYQTGRGDVLGSLRSALRQRYEATRATSDLCRLRAVLHRHRSELLAALGSAGSPDDVAGTDRRIAEVDAELAGRPCAEPTRGEADQPAARLDSPTSVHRPRPAAVEKQPPPPLHPAKDAMKPTRRLRAVGGALVGVGGLAVAGSMVAVVLYDQRYDRLDALDRRLETEADGAELERRYQGARVARTTAIVAGSIGGALLVAGVAALVKSARPRRASVAPAITPNAWGIHLEGRF